MKPNQKKDTDIEKVKNKEGAKVESKGKKKKPAPKESKEVAGENNKKKKKSTDIDDIFATAKTKKKPEEPTESDNKRPMTSGIDDDDDGFFDSRGKSKRKRVDGLFVYTEDELKLGQGGGDTEDCPFDCKCCY